MPEGISPESLLFFAPVRHSIGLQSDTHYGRSEQALGI